MQESGKKESSFYFDGFVPRSTWTLYNADKSVKAYEHFDMSLLLAVDKVYGKVMDSNYTQLLHANGDLDLRTVFLLDQVQKKKTISKDDFSQLKSRNLVEGRYPNIFVSYKVVKAVGDKATYVRQKGLDEEVRIQLILSTLKLGSAKKADLFAVLKDALPDVLTEEQKSKKLSNLLQKMKKDGRKYCVEVKFAHVSERAMYQIRLKAESKFGGGREKIKSEVLNDLKEYFDKYYVVITRNMNFEPVKYDINGEDAKFMMVAEESGRYGQCSKGAELLNSYDDLYNPVNQQKLRNSIERLEKGLGTEHDLVEVDE